MHDDIEYEPEVATVGPRLQVRVYGGDGDPGVTITGSVPSWICPAWLRPTPAWPRASAGTRRAIATRR